MAFLSGKLHKEARQILFNVPFNHTGRAVLPGCTRDDEAHVFLRPMGIWNLGSDPDLYKIKLHQKGYRRVYSVDDGAVVVRVLALDNRENMAAYPSALERLFSRSQG